MMKPPTQPAMSFYSPIPRPVWDLCAAHGLLRSDVAVLGVLLDHKNLRTSEVSPRQETIAARLGVCTRTVERSIVRLREAGLIASRRLRDRLGKLGGYVYDLAAVLGMLPKGDPSHPTRLSRGAWGKPPDPPAPGPAPSPPETPGRKAAPARSIHPTRLSGQYEADSDVAEADNSGGGPTPQTEAAPCPVALELISAGVFGPAARALVAKFGPEKCRTALSALKGRKGVRDKAAWLVGCLSQGWTVRAGSGGRPASAYAGLPKSHQPYRPAWM